MKRKLFFATALLFCATMFAQTGGPDSYGYIYNNSMAAGGPVYDWIEIDTTMGGTGTLSTVSSTDDDHEAGIPIGFNFNFYGVDYDSLSIGSNGAIFFADYYLGLSNVCIPGSPAYSVIGDTAFISPFWDDLNPGDMGNVFYKNMGSSFVIEFSGVVEFGNSDADSWQVILYDNGRILMQYKDASAISANTGSTIGIQGGATIGLEYICDGMGDSMNDSLAILWRFDDLSLQELNKSQVIVSPNPNEGEFNLTISSATNNIFVKIIDIQGRTVYTNSFSANEIEETISLNDVNAGIYVISVDNGRSIVTEKIIIK